MKTHFDESWKAWISTNVASGHDKNGIFKILLDEGYDYRAIKREMNYEPDLPAFMIPNPHKQSRQNQQTQAARGNVGRPIEDKELYLPNSVRIAKDKVDMYLVKGFLNEQECNKLVKLIQSRLTPSTLTGEEADKAFRTSSTCCLGVLEDPFIQEIDTRICQFLGIDPAYGEVIQGQHYEIGQEFKPHTDYFEETDMASFGGELGQRTFTFMIYLNDVEEGGETVFPNLSESFKPEIGSAVIWNSLDPKGVPNYNTLHHAMPVVKGSKTIITKWFRSNPNTSPAPKMYCKEANEYIPAYTKTGFYKSQYPVQKFKEISNFYRHGASHLEHEHIPGDFVYTKDKGKKGSSLINLSEELRQSIHDVMKPLMEEWCGKTLEPTYVYGIRVYHDNAVLKTHRDRLETHIISAIINVDQIVNDDWPLFIEDNDYRKHQLILKPGEMVFYEGGRLLHGRPTPLNGSIFANIFCHFKPVDYVPRN